MCMLRIREQVTVGGWTMWLVVNRDILGGDWQVSARQIRSSEGAYSDWYSPVRHEIGVVALEAGIKWAHETFCSGRHRSDKCVA